MITTFKLRGKVHQEYCVVIEYLLRGKVLQNCCKTSHAILYWTLGYYETCS